MTATAEPPATQVEAPAQGALDLGQGVELLGEVHGSGYKEGAALVKRRDPITNVEKELATLAQGELFGEMSLIDDQMVSADVIAKGPVELLVIPRKEFEALVAKDTAAAVARLRLRTFSLRSGVSGLPKKLKKSKGSNCLGS